ncbi:MULTISPECIES: AI-2E family transporter [Methanothrix]|jgi:predicted PurR-regulated permease PerM|uniref:AI-2E family transporter n=2 Tax=Methanothrix soehngenii TaxID=2223 RepID=A0A7K4AKD7_METSH|nr:MULTISPECIES: AI-2E family transporter [Methanothrix]NYT08622.1 AI-2E family transporter [Methanosarcinales archaeon]MBP7068069.1 AI-2E family transporter [Methanothrix sp.]MDD3551591.1 AI-2E family transporter [Methanothrix soehngenii]MDY0411620.1 AI-2E family transporter [Methanothrix soehngenii]NLJ23447.1 AI-2E family transporter [Methanothrix soehngenii]
MENDLSCLWSHRNWLFAVTLLLILLSSYFLWPLQDGIVLGIVFTYLGRPVRDLFGKRRQIGSLAAIICIIAPLSIIFAAGVFEAASQLRWLQSHRAQIVATGQEFISSIYIPQFIFDELSRGMDNLMGIGLSMLTSLPVFDLGTTLTLGLLNLLIAFCVCYYLLVDGDRLLGATVDFLRQKKGDFELRCLGRIDGILSGIYTGSISTAMVYAIASVPIFYLFDIPRPLAMASIILLAGVVPFLTWLVFLLTAISRYIEMGPMEAAVFFFAASVLVAAVELVVRPYIVYARSSIHPMLVLLAFLGGGLVGGVFGFFLAPAMLGTISGIYQMIKSELTGIKRGHQLEKVDAFAAIQNN